MRCRPTLCSSYFMESADMLAISLGLGLHWAYSCKPWIIKSWWKSHGFEHEVLFLNKVSTFSRPGINDNTHLITSYICNCKPLIFTWVWLWFLWFFVKLSWVVINAICTQLSRVNSKVTGQKPTKFISDVQGAPIKTQSRRKFSVFQQL